MKNPKKDKIIFLDGGTVNYQNDLSFRKIARLGRFEFYHQTLPSQILRRIDGAAIVITNKCVFDRLLLFKASSLQCLCIAATGTNNVDLEAASERGIAVTNVAGYSTESVVQFTLLFILALACRFREMDQWAHDGTWSRSPFFTLPVAGVSEIQGKILGIVGYGAIGKRVVQTAKAFGMKTLIARIPGRQYSNLEKLKRTSFEKVVRKSDFLTIHAP
ncbi:MAG TPA: NAD(P)-dependent oxidoreductase, partial [Candidatus Omnitrophota bacterium]|nr:NAD(P)-dependent oxidoreductase [Candidatus Omnitrophota bacterium]